MTTRSCGGLTNPRGRYPFRVPRLEPSRPGQGQGLPHVSLAYVLRIYWGGAEAALAAEAGRGVNPLHKRLPKGRPPKGETLKEN